VAGFFENMRVNTQALINTNAETEKSIKGSVMPVLERLHKEIKNKSKELAHGAQKGAKVGYMCPRDQAGLLFLACACIQAFMHTCVFGGATFKGHTHTD
jgi:hypothetical protein